MSTEISMDEVKKHRTERSVWTVIHNDVYDLTKFLNSHPGGPEVILEVAGQDSTRAFDDVGHSSDAREDMKKYKIGTLPALEKNQFVDKWQRRRRCTPCDGRPCDGSCGGGSKLKWALLALAGALVIGFVLKKYAT